MQSNGQYADYLPGLFTPLKTSKGYVGIPWGVDTRALWYNKALLAKAGAAVPTDWPSFLAAAKALKKIGVYGYVTAAASSNSAYGTHTLASFMINNGGGMFDEAGNADCLYSRNVEAVEYLLGLKFQGGCVDPGSVSYIDTDVYSELKAGRAGMALANATIPEECGTNPVTGDLVVMSPLAGPHGDKGTIQYLKNYQMYTRTPSIAGSEAFLLWWNEQFVGAKGFYAQGITAAVPIWRPRDRAAPGPGGPAAGEDHQRVGAGGQGRVRPLAGYLRWARHGRQRHGHGAVHTVDPGGEDHGYRCPADPSVRNAELWHLLSGVTARAGTAS